MTDTKRLSLHGRLRMAAACPDPNAPLLAEAADAIEQHEAFRQEVSDAVAAALDCGDVERLRREGILSRFVIAKPDPLVEVMQEWWDADGYASIETFRAALAARGLKIIKKEPSQ